VVERRAASMRQRWKDPEFVLRMSELGRGRKRSLETRQRISSALKGVPWTLAQRQAREAFLQRRKESNAS
jgi:hypothetical protein